MHFSTLLPQAAQEAHDVATPRTDANTADSPVRSAIKGITWRVFSTTLTVLVALAIFGKEQSAAVFQFGAAEIVIKFILYFLHERLWALLPPR